MMVSSVHIGYPRQISAVGMGIIDMRMKEQLVERLQVLGSLEEE